MTLSSVPKLSLKGKHLTFTVPASKSIANRALILAALRKGDTRLTGDFDAEDIQIMVKAIRKIGIRITKSASGLLIQNAMTWRSEEKLLKLDIGNSGTSIRFLTSLVCLRNGTTILTGKSRMMERPIADLVDALRQGGAEIEYLDKEGFPPLKVIGHRSLAGGVVNVKADISSQYLTSLKLISPHCNKPLVLKTTGKIISKPYIKMTETIMRQFSYSRVFQVEGDASAAVYWWALGFLHDATVEVPNVPSKSCQGDARFVSLLRSLKAHRDTGQKTIDMNDMPDASLMLMAIAPCLKFPVKIMNIGSLRVKETDRIAAMATELGRVGVRTKTGKDWIVVWPIGVRDSSPPSVRLPDRDGQGQGRAGTRRDISSVAMTKGGKSVKIETYDDHRIAMSMAILGTKLGNMEILDPDCVKKTYPGFWRTLLSVRRGR